MSLLQALHYIQLMNLASVFNDSIYLFYFIFFIIFLKLEIANDKKELL